MKYLFKIKKLFAVIILVFLITGFNKSKNGIVQMQAFYSIRFPGNIPVNEKGEQILVVDTMYKVVIETNTSEIKWVKAWVNGKVFNILAKPLLQKQIEIGTRKRDNKKIVMNIGTMNFGWELELSNPGVIEKPPMKKDRIHLLIQYQFRGKYYFKILKSIFEINTIPSY